MHDRKIIKLTMGTCILIFWLYWLCFLSVIIINDHKFITLTMRIWPLIFWQYCVFCISTLFILLCCSKIHLHLNLWTTVTWDFLTIRLKCRQHSTIFIPEQLVTVPSDESYCHFAGLFSFIDADRSHANSQKPFLFFPAALLITFWGPFVDKYYLNKDKIVR